MSNSQAQTQTKNRPERAIKSQSWGSIGGACLLHLSRYSYSNTSLQYPILVAARISHPFKLLATIFVGLNQTLEGKNYRRAKFYSSRPKASPQPYKWLCGDVQNYIVTPFTISNSGTIHPLSPHVHFWIVIQSLFSHSGLESRCDGSGCSSAWKRSEQRPRSCSSVLSSSRFGYRCAVVTFCLSASGQSIQLRRLCDATCRSKFTSMNA